MSRPHLFLQYCKSGQNLSLFFSGCNNHDDIRHYSELIDHDENLDGIQLACKYNHENTLIDLINNGFSANGNYDNVFTQSPIDIACIHGSSSCVRALIKRGVVVRNHNVYQALDGDFVNVFTLIIETDFTYFMHDIEKIIFYAIEHSAVSCLQVLINKGVNVNVVDSKLNNTLHHACHIFEQQTKLNQSNRLLDIIKSLVDFSDKTVKINRNYYEKNIFNVTPFEKISMRYHENIKTLFADHKPILSILDFIVTKNMNKSHDQNNQLFENIFTTLESKLDKIYTNTMTNAIGIAKVEHKTIETMNQSLIRLKKHVDESLITVRLTNAKSLEETKKSIKLSEDKLKAELLLSENIIKSEFSKIDELIKFNTNITNENNTKKKEILDIIKNKNITLDDKLSLIFDNTNSNIKILEEHCSSYWGIQEICGWNDEHFNIIKLLFHTSQCLQKNVDNLSEHIAKQKNYKTVEFLIKNKVLNIDLALSSAVFINDDLMIELIES